jgi:hypothetical protein
MTAVPIVPGLTAPSRVQLAQVHSFQCFPEERGSEPEPFRRRPGRGIHPVIPSVVIGLLVIRFGRVGNDQRPPIVLDEARVRFPTRGTCC